MNNVDSIFEIAIEFEAKRDESWWYPCQADEFTIGKLEIEEDISFNAGCAKTDRVKQKDENGDS